MSGARILFLQDNGINESLALAELSGYLVARGHTTRLLLEREERDLLRSAREYQPDLIVVPCNVYAHRWVLDLLHRLDAALPGIPVLVGGTHPTFAPEFINEGPVELQLVGEAEVAVATLADRIAGGHRFDDIPGVWVKQKGQVVKNGVAPRLEDLDDLPLPDRDLYFRYPFMARFPWKKFTTGRGCENSCAFCYNHFIKQVYSGARFVRRKSPRRVVDEIAAVAKSSRLDWVHFADDLFVTDIDWLAEFATAYLERFALPFSCNSSADRMNEVVAKELARAGCKVVAMGVETSVEETRIKLMNKPATDEVIEAAAAHIRAEGMKLVTFLMLGLPGETLEEAIATLRYSRSLGADAQRVMMAVPLPGTMMTMEAAKAGFLDEAQARDFTADVDFVANPYGPYYHTPEPTAFENLANLTPLIHRLPGHLSATLARIVPRYMTRPMRLWMSLQEKGLYRFPLLAGVRYYIHVGNPMHRTTNYVTLI